MISDDPRRIPILEAALEAAAYWLNQERQYANTDHPPLKYRRDTIDDQINQALGR